MSIFPIRVKWFTRPAYSPFTAYRSSGQHNAFDFYTKRGTNILAHGVGVVTRKGWHAGGHGHYVAIQYDGHEVSYSHMIAASPLVVGQKITVDALIGAVGDTGNAFGVDWAHPTAGVLQHVHVEVRRGTGLSGTLIDPLPYFQSIPAPAFAGGSTTPIFNTSQEDEMRVVKRDDGGEWSLFHPSLDGGDALQKGYIVTTSATVGRDWARTWANGSGSEQVEPRDVYIAMQKSARLTHAAYLRALPKVTATAAAPVVDLKPVLDAIGKLPTAEQNGQAARAHIVK